MKHLLFFAIAIGLIFGISCQKEAETGIKLAGVYEVYNYELKYYSDNGNKLDSTLEDTDLGTINLLFEHPNLEQNYMSFNLKGGRFLGWRKIPANTPITWATTEKNEDIILFSNAPDGDVSLGKITLVSYNVDFKSFDKQIWTYIETNSNGAMVKEEVIYLKKL